MCLCYLNLTALRRHDLDAVRSLAPQVIAAAEVARYPAYVAAGKATLTWVAWKDQRFEDVVPLATEALDCGTIGHLPFKWPCLWPLIRSPGLRAARRRRRRQPPPLYLLTASPR